jgi:hypothetical protein
MLSTATKNWKAIFHFYLDELGMKFWSARLFKKVTHDETVCLLSKKNAKPKDYVEISVDAEDYYRIKSSEKDAE